MGAAYLRQNYKGIFFPTDYLRQIYPCKYSLVGIALVNCNS